jgi:hypothetical protein
VKCRELRLVKEVSKLATEGIEVRDLTSDTAHRVASPTLKRTPVLATSFRWSVLALVFMTGCQRVDAPVVGRYRAVLKLSDHELPFRLDVAREDERFVFYVFDGAQRMQLDAVRVREHEISASFPGGHNRVILRASRQALDGTITLLDEQGTEHEVPLLATLGDSYRFYREPLTDNSDVQGLWELTFTNEAGDTLDGVALLSQAHDSIAGTMTIHPGRPHALAGQVHGDELSLASLGEGGAHLYKLKLTPAGDLVGDYWRAFGTHRQVRAKRDSHALLPEAQARAAFSYEAAIP